MKVVTLSAFCLAICAVNAQAFQFDTSKHSVQFGGTYTSGNSETANISATTNTELSYQSWNFESNLETELATSNDQETARSLQGSVELNHTLSVGSYAFSRASMLYDKYATYDFVTRESIGLGRVIFENKAHKLSLQTGPGFLHRRVAGASDFSHRPYLNISNKYSWKISEHATLKQSLSADIDKVTTHIDLTTKIRTAIVKDLALELSFNVNYDTKIPTLSQNQKNMDTASRVTVVYSF